MVGRNDEAYKKGGLALMIGDFLMIAMPPDSLETNVKEFSGGYWKIPLLELVKDMDIKGYTRNGYDLRVLIYGIEVGKIEFDSLESLKSFAAQLDAGVVKLQWDEMLNKAKIATGQAQEEPLTDEFYRKEGLALTISDYLVLGVHPDEVYREMSNLSVGSRKINYSDAFRVMMQSKAEDTKPYLMINFKGSLVSAITFVSFKQMGEFLKLVDEGVHPINWTAIKDMVKKGRISITADVKC
ncbi:hypothetical protein ABD91_26055 [Lysinibacillus sphaericus]|uniref:hypothetical protein n=1 Tax=Lysinibacillus sphaericus TaxID=1421 RepID=UPI0018CD540E|nr:hypothetical protein [Lysinibacillus sphaericus]MBG9694197.1 hypothetical protein [Lysinibacillus sphaericus]